MDCCGNCYEQSCCSSFARYCQTRNGQQLYRSGQTLPTSDPTVYPKVRTLIYGVVRSDPFFSGLKFQNINSNELVHGIRNYNFNINNSVDLAKLYLPGYLAQFSAFDESLDMTAILRLLGFKNYMPIPMFSPHTQASADHVRENVRNKWGHVDVTEWTNALFNDCFVKLETLVRSLGLTPVVERKVLNELADWQTKGNYRLKK